MAVKGQHITMGQGGLSGSHGSAHRYGSRERIGSQGQDPSVWVKVAIRTVGGNVALDQGIFFKLPEPQAQK